MKAHALVLLIPCAVLVACGRTEAPPPDVAAPVTPPAAAAPVTPPPTATAQVMLAGASGVQVAGTLALQGGAEGVSLTGDITGLSPQTTHGIHFHEKGDCSAPDAKSAGEHFNPGGVPHGGPTTPTHHLGDMPNIQSDATGKATVGVTVTNATLGEGGPNDLLGKALIVHAKADDYATQPSGNSGDRIACGVVK
jgi:superoxide dismutase, Cu-Zn family